MSTKITKTGILLTSPEDIIDGATNKNWSGSYSFSNGVFTCNAGTANLNHSQITLLPYDIYCIEFDLRCVTYGGQSGVYVGPQYPNWSSKYVCNQANFNFTTNTWGNFALDNNPYYINNYISTSWGHVKSYVCGSKVNISCVPFPERTGGAATYGISCAKALDGSASTHIYKDQMCFWRLGSNALASNTQFEFRNINAYRLGNVINGLSEFKIQANGITAYDLVEF